MKFNENSLLGIFILLCIPFLVWTPKVWVSEISLSYIYYPFIFLKKEYEGLTRWRIERETLIYYKNSVLKKKGAFVRALVYEPLSIPQKIIVNNPKNLKPGDVALQGDRIAGEIIEVGRSFALIRTIFSPEIRVGVVDKRTKVLGVAKGVKEWTIEILYIPVWADVKEGDTLLTSGHGGKFPSGYKVGIITQVKRLPDELFTEVKAKPLFDPSQFYLYFITR